MEKYFSLASHPCFIATIANTAEYFQKALSLSIVLPGCSLLTNWEAEQVRLSRTYLDAQSYINWVSVWLRWPSEMRMSDPGLGLLLRPRKHLRGKLLCLPKQPNCSHEISVGCWASRGQS